MHRGLIAILVGGFVAAAVATGWGRPLAAESADAAGLTKLQILRQGDQICKEENDRYARELGAFLKKHPKAESRSIQAFISRTMIIPAFRLEAKRLRDLKVARGQQDDLDAILDAWDKALDRGERDPAKFFKTTGGPSWDQAKKLAADYGFEVCIQD
jgi:hypothetical protein